MSVVKAPGGVPIASILAQQVIDGSTLPMIVPSPGVGYRIIRFDAPATVYAGAQYALTFEATGPDSCFLFRGPAGDSYPGGTAYFTLTSRPGWNPLIPTADFGFQTFVE